MGEFTGITEAAMAAREEEVAWRLRRRGTGGGVRIATVGEGTCTSTGELVADSCTIRCLLVVLWAGNDHRDI